MTELQPHEMRVVEEQEQLLLKILALNKFISDPKASGLLEETELRVMRRQLQHMQWYNEDLVNRIRRFVPTTKEG